MKGTVITCFLVGVAVVYLYFVWQRQSVSVVQPPRESGSQYRFSLNEAPSGSIRGTVASISGQVQWTSRVATMPALLKSDTRLQQGESVTTESDSEIHIIFSGMADVSLSPETGLDIVQTLPQNFVFKQTGGVATYTAEKAPLSVTVSHLLAVEENGEMRIAVNSETGLVSVKALTGYVKLAYNSLDYQTVSLTLSKGEAYVFDDATRTGELE